MLFKYAISNAFFIFPKAKARPLSPTFQSNTPKTSSLLLKIHSMIKAMKRLKFWSRKKRKKKITYHPLPYYPPPPPSRPPPPPPLPPLYHHSCCSCTRAVPSAPPLPPSWFGPHEGGDTILAAEAVQPEPAAAEFEHIAIMPEGESSTSSYQQYMVPNPVYGIPVSAQNAKTERSGGFFGCVVNFGMHFIRCFIPCYSIKEVE